MVRWTATLSPWPRTTEPLMNNSARSPSGAVAGVRVEAEVEDDDAEGGEGDERVEVVQSFVDGGCRWGKGGTEREKHESKTRVAVEGVCCLAA